MGWGNTWGGVTHGLTTVQFWGFPYAISIHPLMLNETKFDMVTHMGTKLVLRRQPRSTAHSGFYENVLYKFTFTYLLTYSATRVWSPSTAQFWGFSSIYVYTL